MNTILRSDRKGLTLIELLITMVVAVVVLQVAVSFFIGQSRLVGENESQRASRDVTRTAVNVFMADLRRVETGNGIVSASSSVLEVRTPFAIGVVCSIGVVSVTFSLLPTDSVRLATAIAGDFDGYAIRNPTTNAYGGIRQTTNVTAGDPATCTSNAVTVPPGGHVMTIAPEPLIAAAPGALVMLYDRIRYEFDVVGNQVFLTRSINGGNEETLVGPFDPDATRFRFFTAGSAVAADAPPGTLSDTRGIELVLTGMGNRPAPGGGAVARTALTTAVFFKNRPS